MSTKKNILEKMSSQELEQYVKPESRFVPESIQYAYEILQSRGRTFSAEEQARIKYATSRTQKQEVYLHPNHTKAANIMYLTGVLGIASMVWTYDSSQPAVLYIGIAVAIFAFIFGMGYLAGKGTEWVKYVLLATFLLGLIGFRTIYTNLLSDPVLGVLNIIQTILQVWTLILLFKVPKQEPS